MNKNAIICPVLSLLLVTGGLAQPPLINSLSPNGQLGWTYGYDDKSNGIARIELSTNVAAALWRPVFYDLVSTNILPPPPWGPVVFQPPTNSMRTAAFPPPNGPAGFYRVAVQTNIPDPSLLVHLSFNNSFPDGILLDDSGHGYHAFRYATNRWPSLTIGPDGSQAAEFHLYPDGTEWGSGDYAGIPGYPALTNLTRATIAVWAHYYQAAGANWANDKTATLLDASWWDTAGSWILGRQFWSATTFYIYIDANAGVQALGFPDDAAATGGDTGGWHYYVVTFDGSSLKGYFDGKPCSSFSSLGNATALRIGGQSQYIALGTWAHDGTPQFGDDAYPNCCWMNGAMDDIRIYNRALSDTEVLALYNSFDKQAPAVPTGLWSRTAAPSQIELRWQPSSDNFYVAGYTIRRNGAVVGTAAGPFYADTGLSAATRYSYTVEAFDGAGNRSGQSASISTNTPAAGSPVEVIVDDADGSPWVDILGTWNTYSAVFLPGSWGTGTLVGTVGGGAQSVTFHPFLPAAGTYEVSVWYGAVGGPNLLPYFAPPSVPVDIVHGGVTNTVILNEQQNYANWFSLGSYAFGAGTNGFVTIRTDGTSGYYVVADALRFTK
jgi:hypothetical protein